MRATEHLNKGNKHALKHGKKGSPVYNVWCGILSRANNKDGTHPTYEKIGVSEDWLKFKNFYRDMGDTPAGLSIDRIDNTKGYCKENCRWATRKEQQNNTSRNIWFEFNEKKRTLSQISELNPQLSLSTLWTRLSKYKWSLDKALSTPAKTGVRFNNKISRKKISPEDVIEIRKMHTNGYSVVDLSNKYSLSAGHIRKILNRKSWGGI